MHELAIIEGVLETVTEVAAAHQLSRVTRVEMVIGRMHHLVPAMLVFAFETSAKGTLAEKCKLVIEWQPVFVSCRDCSAESEISERLFICPSCGSFRLNTLSGKELYIKSLTGE